MKPKTEDELIAIFLEMVKKVQSSGSSPEIMVISADDYERMATENYELRKRLELWTELTMKQGMGVL